VKKEGHHFQRQERRRRRKKEEERQERKRERKRERRERGKKSNTNTNPFTGGARLIVKNDNLKIAEEIFFLLFYSIFYFFLFLFFLFLRLKKYRLKPFSHSTKQKNSRNPQFFYGVGHSFEELITSN